MGEIVKISMQGVRDRDETPTTLGASDTISTYEEGKGWILWIYNGSGGTIQPTLDGADAPSALEVPGGGTKDLTAGYQWPATVADGDVTAIPLDTIREYLKGVITVTGASGAKAWIETK